MKAFLVIGTPTRRDLQKARTRLMVVVFIEQDNKDPNQADRLTEKMTAYVNHVESHEYFSKWIKEHQNVHYYGVTDDYHNVIQIFKNSVKTLNKK